MPYEKLGNTTRNLLGHTNNLQKKKQKSFIKHQTQTVQLFWNPCPSNYNQQAGYKTEQRNLTFNVTDLEVMGIR